jgi:hypothetical protein
MENRSNHEVAEGESLRRRFEALNPIVFIVLSIVVAAVTTAISFFAYERPPTEYTRAGTFVDVRKPEVDIAKGEVQFDPLAPVTATPSSSDLDQAVIEIDTVFGELDESKALTPSQLSNQSLGLE